jgi:hypothetical protein
VARGAEKGRAALRSMSGGRIGAASREVRANGDVTALLLEVCAKLQFDPWLWAPAYGRLTGRKTRLPLLLGGRPLVDEISSHEDCG